MRITNPKNGESLLLLNNEDNYYEVIPNSLFEAINISESIFEEAKSEKIDDLKEKKYFQTEFIRSIPHNAKNIHKNKSMFKQKRLNTVLFLTMVCLLNLVSLFAIISLYLGILPK